MNVRELKQLLSRYADDAIVQINVSDHAQTLGLGNIGLDDEYEQSEAIVFTVDVPDDVYFQYEN